MSEIILVTLIFKAVAMSERKSGTVRLAILVDGSDGAVIGASGVTGLQSSAPAKKGEYGDPRRPLFGIIPSEGQVLRVVEVDASVAALDANEKAKFFAKYRLDLRSCKFVLSDASKSRDRRKRKNPEIQA